MRDEHYSYLIKVNGEPTLKREVPRELIERYRGQLPDVLLGYWETEGFNQFRHGLFSSVNPDDWQGVINDWVHGTLYEEYGPFYVVGVTAFGQLRTFSPLIGDVLAVHPYTDWMMSSSLKLLSPRQLDISASIALTSPTLTEDYDIRDSEDERLFERAVRKLGPLGWNEIYAFEPALLLGGPRKLENLVKVDGIVHCSMLRQLIDQPKISYTDLGGAFDADNQTAKAVIAEHRARVRAWMAQQR